MTDKFNSETDLKKNQRIQYLFRYINANLSIPFILLGFCLTSLTFLFSVLKVDSIHIVYLYLIFISLHLSIFFLIACCIGTYVVREHFINLLLFKEKVEEEEKVFPLTDLIKLYLELAQAMNKFLIIGGVLFFVGVNLLLSSLFWEGYVISWVLFISFFVILICYLKKMEKKLNKKKNKLKKINQEPLKKARFNMLNFFSTQ